VDPITGQPGNQLTGDSAATYQDNQQPLPPRDWERFEDAYDPMNPNEDQYEADIERKIYDDLSDTARGLFADGDFENGLKVLAGLFDYPGVDGAAELKRFIASDEAQEFMDYFGIPGTVEELRTTYEAASSADDLPAGDEPPGEVPPGEPYPEQGMGGEPSIPRDQLPNTADELLEGIRNGTIDYRAVPASVFNELDINQTEITNAIALYADAIEGTPPDRLEEATDEERKQQLIDGVSTGDIDPTKLDPQEVKDLGLEGSEFELPEPPKEWLEDARSKAIDLVTEGTDALSEALKTQAAASNTPDIFENAGFGVAVVFDADGNSTLVLRIGLPIPGLTGKGWEIPISKDGEIVIDDAVRDKAAEIAGKVAAIPGKVVDWARDIKDEIVNAGGEIKDAVTDADGNVIVTVLEVGGKIIEKIFSPATWLGKIFTGVSLDRGWYPQTVFGGWLLGELGGALKEKSSKENGSPPGPGSDEFTDDRTSSENDNPFSSIDDEEAEEEEEPGEEEKKEEAEEAGEEEEEGEEEKDPPITPDNFVEGTISSIDDVAGRRSLEEIFGSGSGDRRDEVQGSTSNPSDIFGSITSINPPSGGGGGGGGGGSGFHSIPGKKGPEEDESDAWLNPLEYFFDIGGDTIFAGKRFTKTQRAGINALTKQSKDLDDLKRIITPITGIKIPDRGKSNIEATKTMVPTQKAASGGMVNKGFIDELNSIMGYMGRR
jgi:hypothetical protein